MEPQLHEPDDSLHRTRDELLVIRCQLGESEAFDELVHLWSDRLWRHLRRTAGQDAADDLAQEIWLRAFRGIAGLRDGAKLRSWLFGIAHNVAMDRLRGAYSETAMLAAMADAPDPEPPTEAEARSVMLAEELARLPLVEREALTLFYLEELSLAELAAAQSVPTGTAKSRLFRARRMLRITMTKEEDNV